MKMKTVSIEIRDFEGINKDEIMERLHQEFPHYGWNQNAGYPTLAHRNAIRTHGITPHHRKSFRLLPEQLRLF